MKKITALFLCMGLLLSLAGCDKKQSEVREPETTEKTTILETEAPELVIPTEKSANIRNPFTEERYVAVAESKTRKWDMVTRVATAGERKVKELSDGRQKISYIDGGWSYELDGKEGMGSGDNVWVWFTSDPSGDFQVNLAEFMNETTKEEREEKEFVSGDNWFQMKYHLGLEDGYIVCIENTWIAIYGPNVDYDYFNSVIEEFAGERDYQ